MRRFALISLLIAIVIFQILGEKLPVNEGAMGDGIFYREVAASFLDTIEDESYNAFQIQRILPFAIVNMAFSLFQLDHDNEGLLKGMLIFNFLMLLPGIYWFFSLVDKMRLRSSMEILGFVLLFGNFAVLKEPWYNAFSTDFMSMILGIGLVNYFVRHDRQKLFLLAIISGFVHPVLLVAGLFLIFLPSDPMEIYKDKRPKSLFPLFLTAILLLLLIIVSKLTGRFDMENSWQVVVLHKFSLVALIAFLFVFIYKNPIRWIDSFRLFAKKLKSRKISRLGLVLLVFGIIVFLLSGKNDNLQLIALIEGFLVGMLRFPLDFLVGHLMFFGFVIPLGMVFFPRMEKEMSSLGMGFTAVCLMLFILILHPESRLMMPLFPFMVLLMLKSLRRYRILNKDLYVIGGINLLLSAFWFPLNQPGMVKYLESPPVGLFEGFSAQGYYMHFGNLMSFPVYVLAGFALCLLIFLAWKGKSRYKRQTTE